MRLVIILVAAACVAGCTAAPVARTGRTESSSHPSVQPRPSDRRPERRIVAAARVGARDLFALVNAECAASSPRCTELYRSADAGRSWRRIGLPSGDFVAGSLAFADPRHGWLLQSGTHAGAGTLFATTDGGRQWQRLPLGHVTAVAATAHYVYALAGNILWLGRVGAGRFVRVARSSADSLAVSGTTVAAYTAEVLGRGTGFLLVRGAVATHRTSPCRPPVWSEAIAAAADTVLAVCGSEPGAGNQLKHAFRSNDGGTWARLADPITAGYVFDAAIGAGGMFVTGGRMALTGSRDGRTWHVVAEGSGSADGFSSVAFVDPKHGLAVDSMWGFPLRLTDDGGRRWRAIAVPS